MRKKKSEQKGTTVKYDTVIRELQEAKKPLIINSQVFAKKHSVSTNLVLALRRMGHLEKGPNGYTWKNPHSLPTMQIADSARDIMNELTNKSKPVRQRPSGQRKFNGRKTKAKDTPKAMNHKPADIVKSKVDMFKTVKAKTERPNTDNKKTQLAKKFALMGDYDFALRLLDDVK